jgi:hypothetical protein
MARMAHGAGSWQVPGARWEVAEVSCCPASRLVRRAPDQTPAPGPPPGGWLVPRSGTWQADDMAHGESCRPEMSLALRVAVTKSASRSLRAYTSI